MPAGAADRSAPALSRCYEARIEPRQGSGAQRRRDAQRGRSRSAGQATTIPKIPEVDLTHQRARALLRKFPSEKFGGSSRYTQWGRVIAAFPGYPANWVGAGLGPVCQWRGPPRTRNPRSARVLLEQLAGHVQTRGPLLRSEQTAITHIDEGFVSLGERIVRRPKGGLTRCVYSFISPEALTVIRAG